MGKRLLWSTALCGKDVASLHNVPADLGCGLSTLMRLRWVQEEKQSEPVKRGERERPPEWQATAESTHLETKMQPSIKCVFYAHTLSRLTPPPHTHTPPPQPQIHFFFSLLLQGKCVTDPQLTLFFSFSRVRPWSNGETNHLHICRRMTISKRWRRTSLSRLDLQVFGGVFFMVTNLMQTPAFTHTQLCAN